jgi:hypothetical protein
MPALAMLLSRDSPEPLNEPLVRVIALVGEPDACAQRRLRVFSRATTARTIGARSRSAMSDRSASSEIAAKRHWPVVIERVDLCEHGP